MYFDTVFGYFQQEKLRKFHTRRKIQNCVNIFSTWWKLPAEAGSCLQAPLAPLARFSHPALMVPAFNQNHHFSHRRLRFSLTYTFCCSPIMLYLCIHAILVKMFSLKYRRHSREIQFRLHPARTNLTASFIFRQLFSVSQSQFQVYGHYSETRNHFL